LPWSCQRVRSCLSAVTSLRSGISDCGQPGGTVAAAYPNYNSQCPTRPSFSFCPRKQKDWGGRAAPTRHEGFSTPWLSLAAVGRFLVTPRELLMHNSSPAAAEPTPRAPPRIGCHPPGRAQNSSVAVNLAGISIFRTIKLNRHRQTRTAAEPLTVGMTNTGPEVGKMS